MAMNEITLQQFRTQLDTELDKVVSQHQALRVTRTNGGDFIVMSADDWRAVEETLYLNRVPGLVESLQQAAMESLEEGTRLEELEW